MSWEERISEKRAQVQDRVPKAWRTIIEEGVTGVATPKNSSDNGNVFETTLTKLLTPEEIEITEKDSTSLVNEISQGKLTSEKVVTAFCKRAALVSRLTNAVSEPLYNEAIEQAKKLDIQKKESEGKDFKFPVLFGLPITVKDSFNVPGVQSTLGVVSRLDRAPASSPSPIVDILQNKLGAVVIAKTNVPQAIISPETHNNVFGRTVNPANPKEWGAGGSSGGEGVLISMHGSALGLGTDLAGSIRLPAWNNGAYGYKPSLKLIPYLGFEDAGKPPREPGLTATVGPLGQSVRDLQLFMKAVLETKPWEYPGLEGTLEPLIWDEEALKKKLGDDESFTIGVVTEAGAPPDQEVKQLIQGTAMKLANAGHRIVWLNEAKNIPSVEDISNEVGIPLCGMDMDCTHLKAIQKGGEPLVPSVAEGNKGLYESRVEKDPNEDGERHFVVSTNPYTMSDETLQSIKTKQEHYKQQWNDVFKGHGIDVMICPFGSQYAPGYEGFGTLPFSIAWNVVDVSKVQYCLPPMGKSESS